ncbi:right-handed parallel beta-helix repeat-containing protein [Nocardiopsis xinjiangensis]|uniref:right-handed parallel beta-helix repeat-containing protein n=1 Tax=Nocardiopsis xinjiangensis TaxID=124285 RepID=UPI000348C97F|nr:right-handed parallel beta-helix repeat-containing protein [Nocardiopsis xinjiangensis]
MAREDHTPQPAGRARTRRRKPSLPLLIAAPAAMAVGAGLLVAAQTAPGDEPELTASSPGTAECGSGEYVAEVEGDDDIGWTVLASGEVVHEGTALLEAMQAAVDSLDPARTAQQGVVVNGSGRVPADASLDLPSHTLFEVCGSLDVAGEAGDSHAPVRIRQAVDVEVPHLAVTGAPYFGVFVQSSEDVRFGQIDLDLSGGLGMRIDSRDDDDTRGARDISIDDVNVTGASSHAVETYGVNGFTLGTLTATDVGGSGLLLNDSENADIGVIDAENVAAGSGYAAFRMANRNGLVNGEYRDTVHVGQVTARGGGRGIFCVSESGGATIDRVDIAGTGNDSILIENCHNVTVAAEAGTVEGPGGIRLAAREEFANNSDITLSNLTVIDSEVREDPCGENTVVENVELDNSADRTC